MVTASPERPGATATEHRGVPTTLGPRGMIGLLGRQAASEFGRFQNPVAEGFARQAASLDEDHALHRPPGEIHRPYVRRAKCQFGALGAKADHERVLDDTAEHVAAQQEGEAAEHLSLGDGLWR